MAGYFGFSMSNNAVEAYGNGEMPLSKWTKKKIFEDIEEMNLDLKCSVEILKKIPVKELKNIILCQASWHHTSSHFNKTDFYTIDYKRLESLTDNDIKKLIKKIKEEKEKSASVQLVEEKWKCQFLEWSGSRKHPVATEIIEIGTIKGDWFYRSNGSKKSIHANGFSLLEKIQ